MGAETITHETNKPRAALWTAARSRPVPFSFPAPVAGRTMMFPPQKQRNVRQVLIRGMNPGPIAPYARIIPLDQAAKCQSHRRQPFQELRRQCNLLSLAIFTWSQCTIPLCHCAIVSLSYCPSGYLPIADARISLSAHCPSVRPVAPLPHPHSQHPHLRWP